jgi:hypothetical protein
MGVTLGASLRGLCRFSGVDGEVSFEVLPSGDPF